MHFSLSTVFVLAAATSSAVGGPISCDGRFNFLKDRQYMSAAQIKNWGQGFRNGHGHAKGFGHGVGRGGGRGFGNSKWLDPVHKGHGGLGQFVDSNYESDKSGQSSTNNYGSGSQRHNSNIHVDPFTGATSVDVTGSKHHLKGHRTIAHQKESKKGHFHTGNAYGGYGAEGSYDASRSKDVGKYKGGKSQYGLHTDGNGGVLAYRKEKNAKGDHATHRSHKKINGSYYKDSPDGSATGSFSHEQDKYKHHKNHEESERDAHFQVTKDGHGGVSTSASKSHSYSKQSNSAYRESSKTSSTHYRESHPSVHGHPHGRPAHPHGPAYPRVSAKKFPVHFVFGGHNHHGQAVHIPITYDGIYHHSSSFSSKIVQSIEVTTGFCDFKSKSHGVISLGSSTTVTPHSHVSKSHKFAEGAVIESVKCHL